MDFLARALQAIPSAATHPFALIAYLAVVIAWVVIGLRISRIRQLLKNIEKLPSKDRLPAIQAEMGHVSVPEGLTAAEWLQQKRQNHIFVGFIAVLLSLVVVIVIAVTQSSNTDRSKAELLNILKLRESKLSSQFEAILSEYGPQRPIFFGETLDDEGAKEITDKIRAVRDETYDLIERRRIALDAGNLVLAHELGNELNAMADEVRPLISSSEERSEGLEEAVRTLSTMCPQCMWDAMAALERENAFAGRMEDIILSITTDDPELLSRVAIE